MAKKEEKVEEIPAQMVKIEDPATGEVSEVSPTIADLLVRKRGVKIVGNGVR